MVSVEFEQADALLVVDVMDDFEHEDADSLLASFRERGATIASVIAAAREAGIPVIYVNDDRDRWDSDAPGLAQEAAGGPGGEVVRALLPTAADHILLKHRYSAFDHTALELLLEGESVERVVVVGAATEGCVVQTALDAREHGLKATILADACATVDAELEQIALRYAQDVGGIYVRQFAPLTIRHPRSRREAWRAASPSGTLFAVATDSGSERRGGALLLLAAAVLAAVLIVPTTGASESARHRTPYAGLGTWLDIYATASWTHPQREIAAMARA